MRAVLPLEEALENTPQTRALVGLLESEALLVESESGSVCAAVGAVSAAAAALSSALSELSATLVPMGERREEGGVERRLGVVVEETASSFQLLATQLANCVLQPIAKLTNELAQLEQVHKPSYHLADGEQKEAYNRFCKLSRKDSPQKIQEANLEVFESNKIFHESAVTYFCALNGVAASRERWLVEPLLGLVYAFRASAAATADALRTPALTDFLAQAQERIQGVHSDFKAEQAHNRDVLHNLAQAGSDGCEMYYAEPPSAILQPQVHESEVTVQRTQIQGYLHLKTLTALSACASCASVCSRKASLGWHWSEAEFYHTAGQMLMRQGRDEFGAQMLLDLSEALSRPSKDEARPFGIIAALAASEDRRNTFSVTLPPSERADGSPSKKDKPRVWIFQARSGSEAHQWVSVLNCVARLSESGAELSSAMASLQPPSAPIAIRSGAPPTPQSTPVAFRAADHAALPSQPIQFDLLNDFGAPPQPDDGAERRSWTVRFLGSQEVHSDTGAGLVVETMRQVLAARAAHDIFAAPTRNIVVDPGAPAALWLQDSESGGVRRLIVPLQDLAFWAVHPDNAKLLGFIARDRPDDDKGPARFVCHILDSEEASGAEICDGFSSATQKAFQALVARRASQASEK